MIFGINWQYFAVGLILIGVIVWILVHLFGKKYRNESASGCIGCALSESCTKQKTDLAQECLENDKKNRRNIG